MPATVPAMASEQRQLWGVLEPYHAMVYFAPEAMENYRAAGLKGFWMGYFASRSAAFGPATPELVIATFYNFNPAMVRRAIPDAWSFATPQSVLDARHRGADACLARLLGAGVDDGILAEAAGIAREAALACDPSGRALFAAHASLPWPEAPRMALWHAATLLREHRADGHIAALLAEGVNGVQAHVLQVARRRMPREIIEPARGWNEATWNAETESLRGRGWLDATRLRPDCRRSGQCRSGTCVQK